MKVLKNNFFGHCTTNTMSKETLISSDKDSSNRKIDQLSIAQNPVNHDGSSISTEKKTMDLQVGKNASEGDAALTRVEQSTKISGSEKIIFVTEDVESVLEKDEDLVGPEGPSEAEFETEPLFLFERVDYVALKRLIEHPDVTREDVRKLTRYAATLDNDGIRKVTYTPSARGIGRVYADLGLSLQFFSKRIRHSLAKDLYHDIDMVNAHPVILLQLCQEKNWEAPQLERYVKQREQILREVMDAFKVSRKQAKELFLRLMYGGSTKYWMQDERIVGSASVPKFVAIFERELKCLQQRIWDEYPEIREIAKKSGCKKRLFEQLGWNKSQATRFLKSKGCQKGSCMSLVLQQREHKILMAMTEFFQAKDWEVGVFVFDGLMLSKQEGRNVTPGLLQECEQFVQQETGWPVRLEEKSMDCGFDLDFNMSNWDLEYSKNLLEGIPLHKLHNDPDLWKALGGAAKAIGMPLEIFQNWLAKKQADVTKEQIEVLWNDPKVNSKGYGWRELEEISTFLDNHNTRPIMDLQCPYGIDALLEAKTMERVQFVAPKVLALVTGVRENAWFKKVIVYNDGRKGVKFVRMQNGLSSLGDFFIDFSRIVTVSDANGETKDRVETNKARLDALVKKYVLSDQPKRMTFTKLDFFPYSGRFSNCDKGVFNTFAGFPFQPAENGDELDYSPIAPFLDGMKEVLCGGDESLYTATCDFFSDILQHPERKPRCCPVWYSPEQQVGKGFFTLTIAKILVGDEMMAQISNDELIVGTFNGVLEDKLIIIVDDPDSYGASHKCMGRLKNLITEPTVQVHRKGLEAYVKRSCTRVTYCTNTVDAICVELFDRRFLMSQCCPSRVGQSCFFDRLAKIARDYDWLLWNYFYHRQLSHSHWWNHLPISSLKRQLVRKKFPLPVQFAISSADFWKGQDLKGTADSKKPIIRWHYEYLYQQYRTWAIHEGVELRYLGKNWTSIEEPLKVLGIQPSQASKGRIMIQKRRLKGFEIPRQDLLASIRHFLRKSAQDDADGYEPPDVEVDNDTDNADDADDTESSPSDSWNLSCEIDNSKNGPDVLGHSYKPRIKKI